MTVTDRVLQQIALSRAEYALALQRLGRAPMEVELGMIGALWSEHCGYKNSKPLLRLFPTSGEHVLTRAGEENAGAVDIGAGLLVAMKIESHNHPSAIEPSQGAATGVGGIVRDIFAMGARPIALLDSLRFGPIAAPSSPTPIPHPPSPDDLARNRYLFAGVVGGIGGYGNCLGLPTVGGETVFDDSYSGNPLVNAMCVGVARIGELVRARADGPGNLLMVVGADTGRDGIHGATFASVELDESSEERRPAVQVGNPFLEKLLMEACLELVERGRDWIVGLQDLGAAGLTSAAVECAAKAGTGLVIDVDRVPRREEGMNAYEVMLSESQERMLVIAKRDHEDRVRALFERWDLHAVVIGEVTDDGLVRVHERGVEVACLPARLLTDPPLYRRQGVKPPELEALQQYDLAGLPDLPPERAEEWLLSLLSSPNIASKRWIWRQYDHQVLTNTVLGPGHGAAVVRIKGTRRAIALSTDCNGRLCYLDPYAGGAIAVAEAARNVVCTGAEPIAVTDCLNFGNPEKPEIYYQLEQAITGMSAACDLLGTPVISGNVSLYNETLGTAVYPTPVVGMLGLIEDVDLRCDAAFRHEGDAVVLLSARERGPETKHGITGDASTLAGSEYLRLHHALVAGQPRIDLQGELALQRCTLAAIRGGLLSSAHDCADGGLAVALAECAVWGDCGFDGSDLPTTGRLDAALFGEAQSRIVVSLPSERLPALEHLAAQHEVAITRLGSAGGNQFRLTPHINLSLGKVSEALENGLPQALAGV
ncbi:MAG: phosphoribosylformylglycinamidine synthase subunit PurL [Chloroflexi bacterium]|nr:phosphoribosylformylglycinamidine synthase subunit PurL [Chloroflexota bacterium]